MAAFEPSAGFAPAASSPPSAGSQTPAARQPLEVHPTFCPVDVDSPFDTTEWELRTAAIKGEDGKVLFEQPAMNLKGHYVDYQMTFAAGTTTLDFTTYD